MLPAELAREVKRIQFVTGRQVANVMAGAYLSVFKGRGMEFDEVRPVRARATTSGRSTGTSPRAPASPTSSATSRSAS
jgi:hypothetical protein